MTRVLYVSIFFIQQRKIYTSSLFFTAWVFNEEVVVLNAHNGTLLYTIFWYLNSP